MNIRKFKLNKKAKLNNLRLNKFEEMIIMIFHYRIQFYKNKILFIRNLLILKQ